MNNGRYCDSCQEYLHESDFHGRGAWSYTCHACGFPYVHYVAQTLHEQLSEFRKAKAKRALKKTQKPIRKAARKPTLYKLVSEMKKLTADEITELRHQCDVELNQRKPEGA